MPPGNLLLETLGSMSAGHFLRVQEQAIPKCRKSSKRGSRPAWLSRDLLQLRQKRKVFGHWKQRQATWEDYRDTVCHCKEKISMAKGGLEFKLASILKDNKKGF